VQLISYLRVSTRLLAIAALLGALLIFLHSTNPASALSATAVPGTTITVNSNGDGTKTGNCTLREAIEAANTNKKVDRCAAGSATEEDAIFFSVGDKATIVLGSQLPDITDQAGVHINGQKAKVTVSGNDSVRVFWVNSGAKLTLRYMRVADGFATDLQEPYGAGLLNDGGTVKVINSTFSGNNITSTQGAFGGAISNGGTLTVTNSTFSGNRATNTSIGTAYGGGIINWEPATATITNSTFS
jgi:CSLREA domain-containing protein